MKTLILLVSVAICGSSITIQTDWSQGSGQTGPVSDWGNSFYSSSSIDGAGTPGEISLCHYSAISNTVTSDLTAPACIDTRDFDNEGNLNIACAGFVAQKLVWMENGGPGAWIMHDVDSGLPGCCATVGVTLTMTDIQI